MSDLIVGADGVARCAWAGSDPLYVDYHDGEWGRPLRGDDRLFELLTLEGFQAGLAWITILRKRERFRAAFDGFRVERVAGFGEADVERLLSDTGIVRHRGKIEAAIGNARAASNLPGGLTELVWSHAPYAPATSTRVPREHPGDDLRVGGALEGASPPRLSIRRTDDRLRLHAVGRSRGRPSGGLRDPLVTFGFVDSGRIARVEAWPVDVPLDAPYLMAPGTYWGMSRTVVRVTTADGIVGLGEAPSPGHARVIGDLADGFVGQEVAGARRRLAGAARLVRTAQRVDERSADLAATAIEMALWDIEARAAGLPFHELLGGACRTEIPFTEYFAHRTPGPAARGESSAAEIAAYCAKMVEEFASTAFEGKVAVRPVEEELRMVREVRQAIGTERALRLDANRGWRLDTARAALAALADLDLANVEEPVGSFQEMRELRLTSSIPFSAHDPDLALAAELGVPDSLVLSIGACGGIAGTLDFVAACERAGVGFWFYSGDLGIATAAYLHLAAALPYLAQPSQSLLRWYTDDVIAEGPFSPRGGLVSVPTGYGLGVELDEAALARGVERFARDGEYDLYDGPPLPRY